jgi:poly(3-hydroxybutyrate) depolymerase
MNEEEYIMKKLLIMLLALILCTSSVSMASEIPVQQFDPNITIDTSENLYTPGFYGLCARPIDVDGTERMIYVYTPKNYEPCCEMLLVFVPNGKTGPEFAGECGLTVLSEKYGFGMAFYEGLNAKWDLENPENEIAYYLAAAKIIGTREIIDTSEASLYISGYGEGSDIAQYIALNHNAMFAGGLFMGGSDISAEYLTEVGEKQNFPFGINSDFTTQIDGYYNKDTALPVWIVNDGNKNAALIEYWKTANETLDKGLTNGYAKIYEQDKLSLTQTINNKPYSRVWVSDIAGAASYFDPTFQEFAWTEFLTQLNRFTSEANGAFRQDFTMDQIGAKKYDLVVNGENRYYYVYAPTYYDGSKPLPVVLALPGHSISAALFAQQTEWWRLAESSNFLVVFGMGSRCPRHPLSGCNYWGTTGEELEKELAYFDQVLAGMKETYNVDSTRIYVTGHSNGGRMTRILAEVRPEVFAAAANVAGLYSIPTDTAYELPKAAAVKIPYLAIAGKYDGKQGIDYVYVEGERAYEDIRRQLALNDMLDAKEEVKDTGTYTKITYRGTNLNIPMVQYMSGYLFHHCYTPEQAKMIWEELFCYFSRGEDGTIYYLGTPVECD